LSRARKQARTVQCLTHSRGLSQTLQTYVADWNGGITFHGTNIYSWPFIFISKPPTLQVMGTYGGGPENTHTTVGSPQGNYGVSPKMFLCPETIVDTNTTGSAVIGSSTKAWTGSPFEIGWDPNIPGANNSFFSGGYGLNAFLYNNFSSSDTAEFPGVSFQQAVAAIGVSSNRAFRLPSAGSDADIPAFADCNWYHVAPSPTDIAGISLTDPGPSLYQGPTSVLSAYYPTLQPFNPMKRVVMDRHNLAVNVSFVDGHAATVPLKELWTLKWSADWRSRPASSIVLPLR
jgi:prepilin-type processing-associated H-X9-DG protein